MPAREERLGSWVINRGYLWEYAWGARGYLAGGGRTCALGLGMREFLLGPFRQGCYVGSMAVGPGSYSVSDKSSIGFRSSRSRRGLVI